MPCYSTSQILIAGAVLLKSLLCPLKGGGETPRPQLTSLGAIRLFLRRWKTAILNAALLLLALFVLAFVFHREPNISFHPMGGYCERFDVPLSVKVKPFPGEGFAIEPAGGALMAFVEFDDQGPYFDQRQSFAALRLIRESIEEKMRTWGFSCLRMVGNTMPIPTTNTSSNSGNFWRIARNARRMTAAPKKDVGHLPRVARTDAEISI